MPKRIPVKSLKTFSKDIGLTHAVLYAHDGEREHIVTYGQTVEQCSQAADFGNSMKDFLGWPESLHAQPPRVKKLEKELKELKELKNMNQSIIIKLNALDYNANYAYAPPARPILLNIEDISSIKPTEARGFGDHSFIKMKNGDHYTVEGSPEEIHEKIFEK